MDRDFYAMGSKHRLIALAVCLAGLAAMVGRAQPWLSEDERLMRGDVIISFKEAPGDGAHEVQGEILFDATPDVVWAAVTDYDSWARIFPDLESTQVVQRKGSVATVKCRINNLWPSPDFEYTLKMTEDLPNWTVTWDMVDGNLKELHGSVALTAYEKDDTRTKAVYRLTRDTGWFLPLYSPDLANRSLVIDRLLALRVEVRNRKKAAESGKSEAEIKPKWRKALFWWEKEEPDENGPQPGDTAQNQEQDTTH